MCVSVYVHVETDYEIVTYDTMGFVFYFIDMIIFYGHFSDFSITWKPVF